MKVYHVITIAALFMAVLMAVMTGCKYDGPTAVYYQPHTQTGIPAISGLNPGEAGAGVNYITITGMNFSADSGNNKVYFDKYAAEIVNESATSITVRRPNSAGDSTTVKVVSYGLVETAKYTPYKITSVSARYGGFISNVALSSPAVGDGEILYVTDQSNRNIVRVTPDGVKTTIGIATRIPTDAKIGPDGNLYLIENNRILEIVDLQTNTVTEWVRFPSGKSMRYGDFDANGYFYTGGLKTDLFIIAPDKSNRASGIYAKDEILAVRVYNGYLYVITKAGTASAENPAIAIWKHPISAGGVLGTKQLVLDWSTTGEFSTRTIKGLTFSSNGTMFIGTDSPNPMLMYNPATQVIDVLYKGILPSYCKYYCWGKGNYLYMIRGDTNLAEEWTVYRIDTGIPGAPYY